MSSFIVMKHYYCREGKNVTVQSRIGEVWGCRHVRTWRDFLKWVKDHDIPKENLISAETMSV